MPLSILRRNSKTDSVNSQDLIDRLNDAIDADRIELVEEPSDVALANGAAIDLASLGVLFAVLFPLEYADPLAPASPTGTPPGGVARARVYAARRKAGQHLYHAGDGCPLKNDRRGLAVVKRMNGAGAHVHGWDGE